MTPPRDVSAMASPAQDEVNLVGRELISDISRIGINQTCCCRSTCNLQCPLSLLLSLFSSLSLHRQHHQHCHHGYRHPTATSAGVASCCCSHVECGSKVAAKGVSFTGLLSEQIEFWHVAHCSLQCKVKPFSGGVCFFLFLVMSALAVWS